MLNCKGLLFRESSAHVLYRTTHVPLWLRDDGGQRVVPMSAAKEDAHLFWARLAPVFGDVFHRARRFAFQLPRSVFGELSDLLLGKGQDSCPLVSVQCRPLAFDQRPCEWSIFVAAMVVSTPAPSARTSVLLLTALEIEYLQMTRPDFFGMSRAGLRPEQVCTPSQCFGEIHSCAEVTDKSDPRPCPGLVGLVQELRRIRCFEWDKAQVAADEVAMLQHLHVIILAVGLAGVAVLSRAHANRPVHSDLLLFYENFHWVVRSFRFQRYLSLKQPSCVVLTAELDDWVRSFECAIDASVNGAAISSDFSFDGIVPKKMCNISLADLKRHLGKSVQCLGRSPVVHSYVENGVVMQTEDEGALVRFDELVSYWEKKKNAHSCKHANCSIQVRWTLTLEECCGERGRTFCNVLYKLGMHPFFNEDLLLRSVGWIDGFTAPYFMCRQQGAFVGHSEQGGSSACGCLLAERSASMKWEASYYAHGKMVNDLRRFITSRAMLAGRQVDKDTYPGPLLWSDDPNGSLIIEGLGMVVYFGASTIQRPGEFAMTARSRTVEDRGLFVEYHQTTTVDSEDDSPPLIFFAQNLAPLTLPWCKDVLPAITNPEMPSDVVLRCWGLGYLLFCRTHGHHVAAPDVVSAARLSVLREILMPTLQQLSALGPSSFVKRVVLHRRLDELLLPYDLYAGTHKGAGHAEVFRACVCEVCFKVISNLLWQEGTMFMCAICADMKSNGVVWEPGNVVDLLNIGVPSTVQKVYEFNAPDQLRELSGKSIVSVLNSAALAELQLILQSLFPLRDGDVVTSMALEKGMRIAVGPVVALRDGVQHEQLFRGQVPLKLFGSLVCFGPILNVSPDNKIDNGRRHNCTLRIVDSKYAELVVDTPIAVGEELLMRVEPYFQRPGVLKK